MVLSDYRFAFDLGTTSIGWAVFELDGGNKRPVRLERLGVRIFEDGRDPQSGDSNAKGRQLPRSLRKGQDRKLVRRKLLLADLEAHEMLPPVGAVRDALFLASPYEIRSRAATQKVSLYEMGRALWHMSKHRGFKSNRKTDAPDDDTGLIKTANKLLRDKLEDGGWPTYGAYLWARLQSGEGVRVRAVGENAEKHYDFYPTRDMLTDEFDAIWQEQSKYHPELTEDLRLRLRDYTIFYQRPLKPVPVGRCTFFPEKDRLPRWHPAAQAFLILQQLSNLRIIRESAEFHVDFEKRQVLFNTLNGGEKLTWTGVKKILGLSSQDKLNLHDGGLKELHYNQVAAVLLGTKRKPGPLAMQWGGYAPELREEILKNLTESESPEVLIDWLNNTLGLEPEAVQAVEDCAPS